MGASVTLLDTLAVLHKAGLSPAELASVVANYPSASKGKRRFSAKTRRRMALAQKARWAKVKKVSA